MTKRTKRILALLLTVLILSVLAGCGNDATSSESKSNEKVTVIATLFPQYDFAKIVGGDKADVVKLLPNGMESHSYEPTPGDIVAINDADIFLYTGAGMEPWAGTIIDSIQSKNLNVVDVSKDVPLLEIGEDDHGDHGADPHIWTDPTRAMIMVDNITAAFCSADPENAEYYEENATNYKKELTALDDTIKDIVANGSRNKIIFGGRFAFLYFCDHYGLEYDAAYDSCAESGEPSAKKIADLIEETNAESIPVIYYEELRKPTVAKSLSDATGAKTLLLHSCHNVTEDQLQEGVSYLSLMQQNAENLKEGLN